MTEKSSTDHRSTPEKKAGREFFTRDVLKVAPDLLSCFLAVRFDDCDVRRFLITETEAYRGEEDKACHASRGRTPRTDIMYHEGGRLYIYLVYGIHWMLNIVTGRENDPQAVLIRGLDQYPGPGLVTKGLGIDRSFNCEDLVTSERIWLEKSGVTSKFRTGPRIGIDYAGEYWKTRPWRYFIL